MKLIKLTGDHYVIVDDSEIKEGDLCYDPEGSPGYNNIKYIVKCLRTASDSYWNKHCKKITHSNIGHLYQDSILSLSLQEVKELIGEVDVEKKAFNYTSSSQAHRRGFIDGYNQALEDNKDKKYTEEDIRLAFGEGVDAQFMTSGIHTYEQREQYRKIRLNMFIQSLQPKTEWEVEIIDGKLTLKK